MITGSGFIGTTAVDFDAKAAVFVVNSDTSITATTPPHSPQVITVSVTSMSGTSPSTADSFFTYQGDWSAYVLNNFSNNTTVINANTNQVIATIEGQADPAGIAFTPDGTKALITNSSGTTTFVIDTATNTVIASPTVGEEPSAVSITPDGTKGYIATNNVAVIDVPTNTISTIIPVGNSPETLAITPDGTQVYVLNLLSMNVSVINTETQMVIATIPLSDTPSGIAITPDGAKVYVLNDSSISVISTASNQVITTISLPNSKVIILSPDGTKAYVLNDAILSVIDTNLESVSATIPTGDQPLDLAVTPDGTKVYVVNFGSANVTVINTLNNTVETTISVGPQPDSVAITPDGTKAFVSSINDSNVSIIDTTSNTVIATAPVGSIPETISITPDQAPLAKFTVVPAAAGLPTIFDASLSLSPTGFIAQYNWDFGDGNSLVTSLPSAQHTYQLPGLYTVILTVVNSAGTSTTQIFNISSNSFHSFNATFIINNGGPTATATETISIPVPAPIVMVVFPNSGPARGGNIVTIRGFNFTGATAVLFGSTPAQSFEVIRDTSISVVAPPGKPNTTVDVRVVTPGGISSITPADRYTYNQVPFPPRNLRVFEVKERFATQTDRINVLRWEAPFDGTPPVAYLVFRKNDQEKLIAVIPANQKLEFFDHNRRKNVTYFYSVVAKDQFGNLSAPSTVVIKDDCNSKNIM